MKKIILFLGTIFFIGLGRATINQECDYYTKKNEEILCTGRSNYLNDYGLKYCLQFTNLENKNNTSINLQNWISGTRNCLQEMLEDHSEKYRSNCRALKKIAFEVHSYCYEQQGICDLSVSDLSKVMVTLLQNDFIIDFAKNQRSTFQQIKDVVAACTFKRKINR